MRKEEIKVVIERGDDGTYSAYMDNYSYDFHLVGDGKTVEEAKESICKSFTINYLHIKR